MHPVDYERDFVKGEEGFIERHGEGSVVHPMIKSSDKIINEKKMDNSFYRGKLYIQQCCASIKLSERIAVEAESMLCNVAVILDRDKNMGED